MFTDHHLWLWYIEYLAHLFTDHLSAVESGATGVTCLWSMNDHLVWVLDLSEMMSSVTRLLAGQPGHGTTSLPVRALGFGRPGKKIR